MLISRVISSSTASSLKRSRLKTLMDYLRACPSRPAALLAQVQGTTSLILYVYRAGFF